MLYLYLQVRLSADSGRERWVGQIDRRKVPVVVRPRDFAKTVGVPEIQYFSRRFERRQESGRYEQQLRVVETVYLNYVIPVFSGSYAQLISSHGEIMSRRYSRDVSMLEQHTCAPARHQQKYVEYQVINTCYLMRALTLCDFLLQQSAPCRS